MKTSLLVLVFLVSVSVFSQVGINTTNPNAQLEIVSSNQASPSNTDGILIPKIDTFPNSNPGANQQGMLVYLTQTIGSNTPGFYYWDNLTVSWISIGDTINSSGWKLNGNSIAGTDFLGTTNNQDLNFKRDNTEAGFIGASQTALGIEALNNLTSGFANNAFGLNALRNNSSGNSNNAFGNDALSLNTAGNFNSAFGQSSLNQNTASNNTAFGYLTLTNNTTGSENTALGGSALATNSIGSNNVAVGFESQLTNTSGISNTAIGHFSMNTNTTGGFNTAVGTQSLTGNTTGLFNNAFGYLANVDSGNLMNATAIGTQALVASNNSMVLGSIQGVNGAFESVNVGIGTTTPLDRLHVEGNIRMVDGNQAVGRVLTSDANGTASWTDFTNLASGTLDEAYDFGGAGNGRTITADTGAVLIDGTDGLVSTGTLNSGALAPGGSGVKMFWNPRKAAFRAGKISFDQWDDTNIGESSAAFGNSSRASGQNSFAAGNNAYALGNSSTAFGSFSNANGSFSFSNGLSVQANGIYSAVFGESSSANGTASYSFGRFTYAIGEYSTTIGLSNTSRSFGEVVIGLGATDYTPSTNGATQFGTANATDRLFVIGNAIDSDNSGFINVAERSDAMIILKNGLTRLPSTTNAMIDAADGKTVVTKEYLQTSASGTLDQAYDFGGAGNGKTITADNGAVLIDGTDGFVSSGISGTGAFAPTGAGTRMVWNPRKAAFRAGNVGGTQWDDVNIGNNSVAFGTNSTASGASSFAFGIGSTASGTGSFAFGAGAISTGQSSFAFGQGTSVLNGSQDAIAIGIGSQSSAVRAISIGAGNIASGPSSVAIGNFNTTSGFNSVTLGAFNISSGNSSTSFGLSNTAPSYGETVLGIGATTYTPSTNGDAQFRTTNATDRLFVIGNAIDTNNNNNVDAAERSDAMVVLKNGNIGVGISAPTQRLHISGRALFENGFSTDNAALLYKNDTDYMFIGPQSGSSSNGGALALFGSTNTSTGNAGGMDINVPNGSVRLFHNNGGYTFRTNSTSGYTGLFELNDTGFVIGHNSASRDLLFSPNSTERMRLTPGGFLGIGTTTPARKLHVSNGVSGGTSNGNTGILLESSGNVYQHFLTPSTGENGLLFGSQSASINGGIIFNNSAATNGIQFRTGGNTNRMTITSIGDVGIGINSPQGALDVTSSNNGILIPRVILTAANVQAPVVNPAGGALPQGTLVYNTNSSGTVPNDVTPGFYYWNNTNWTRLGNENKTRYYTAIGTTNSTFNIGSVSTLVPQMTISLVPTGTTVMVNFNASGRVGSNALSDPTVEGLPVAFRLLLDGVVVTTFFTIANGAISTSGFGYWDINFNLPVTVQPGVNQTISVEYQQISTGSYFPGDVVTNFAANTIVEFGVPLKHHRVLTVIDP